MRQLANAAGLGCAGLLGETRGELRGVPESIHTRQRSRSRGRVDVWDAVGVIIVSFRLLDASVYHVADPQHHGGQGGGEQAADEDGDLDLVVSFPVGAERSSPMTRDTVNPMPPSNASPHTSNQFSSSSSYARVNRASP